MTIKITMYNYFNYTFCNFLLLNLNIYVMPDVCNICILSTALYPVAISVTAIRNKQILYNWKQMKLEWHSRDCIPSDTDTAISTWKKKA